MSSAPTPKTFRKLYLLNICIATAGKNEGDIREACDAAEEVFRQAIAEAYEEAAKIVETRMLPYDGGSRVLSKKEVLDMTAAIRATAAPSESQGER